MIFSIRLCELDGRGPGGQIEAGESVHHLLEALPRLAREGGEGLLGACLQAQDRAVVDLFAVG